MFVRALLSSAFLLISACLGPLPQVSALLDPVAAEAVVQHDLIEEKHEEADDEAPSEDVAPEVEIPAVDAVPALPSSPTGTTAAVDLDTSLSESFQDEPTTLASSSATSLSGHLTSSTTSHLSSGTTTASQ